MAIERCYCCAAAVDLDYDSNAYFIHTESWSIPTNIFLCEDHRYIRHQSFAYAISEIQVGDNFIDLSQYADLIFCKSY